MSKRIALSKVPAVCEARYGFTISRITVFNWINSGRGGVKLKVMQVGPRRYTTEDWLHEFVAGTMQVGEA